MDDIELNSRRGTRSRTYDALPQQDHGTPPSYDGDLGSRPLNSKNAYSQSIPMLESNPKIVISREPTYKLPPKAYVQSSIRKRVLIHIGLASAFILGLGLPLTVFMPILSTNPSSSSVVDTACTSLIDQGWFYNDDFSFILNIDIAYGNLSFGMAKFIDLVWDVFISRGGQIMLGWVTYRVHSAALMRIMEKRPVSYDLYATMTLSWATVWSLRPLTVTFFTKIGFRRKLLLFWLAISIIWVAIWPTSKEFSEQPSFSSSRICQFMDIFFFKEHVVGAKTYLASGGFLVTNAMTGYVAKNDTLVKLGDGSGYGNYTDIVSDDNLAFQYYSFYTEANYSRATNWKGPRLMEAGPNVTLWNILHDALHDYPAYVTSLYNDTLPGVQYTQPATDSSDTPCFVFYYYRNQTYDYNYFQIPENVQCVATSKYQWGFSTGVFLVFVVFNAAWVTGTYGVWIHMNRKSELTRKHRSLGKYRAAVDMVEAITADLGNNICAYSDHELERVLKRGPGIKYAVTYRKEDELPHIGVSSGNNGERLRLNFGELYGGRGKENPHDEMNDGDD